jgi:DNA-binding transcriptional LysR family regulator
LRARKLDAALTIRPPPGQMRGLNFEAIRRHQLGIICACSSSLAEQSWVRPSVVARSKLVVYRAREFPDYHQLVANLLGVSKRKLIIGEECDGVFSVLAAVEAASGVAVVGQFITAVTGDRVRFVPFGAKAHSLDVGLLYRQSGSGENVRQLIAACLAVKQPT